MLVSLAIGNVVLIDRVDLVFGGGLCVLTGETGAGKSILLDSLGLALGMRASAGMVRSAPDGPDRASVTATFQPDDGSPIAALLTEAGLVPPEDGEALILRRTVDAAGRSRAFVNDQPVSVALMRRIGDALVEIEGQFATQGLMDAASHRAALDSFGGLANARTDVGRLYRAWRDAEDALAGAEAELARGRVEEAFLRHAAGELAELDPRPDEETRLAETRSLLMHGEKLVEAIRAAETALASRDGVEDRIGAAVRALVRQGDAARGRFDAILDALARASDGIADAFTLLNRAMADSEPDPGRLEASEERLFALRAAARKHNTAVDALPALRRSIEDKLAAIEDDGAMLAALARTRDAARAAYRGAAEALSHHRAEVAAALDAAIEAELPPLRLDKARFATVFERLDEDDWGPAGIDRIHFEVATNPGAPAGPLARIASGGELARFLLALKVVLHRANAVPTLVFDEVDSGVGGATATAVGERLARLAREAQVLVVTHSPQVAAFASRHLRVAKKDVDGGVITIVEELTEAGRREEIARMLAGAKVTEEARAAADSLIVERLG